MRMQSILWRCIEWPGHEAAQLFQADAHWNLTGSAVFAYQQQPCRLDYLIVCDEHWHTLSAIVGGWVGQAPVQIEIKVDSSQHWQLNGSDQPQLAGCIDLDLNFSPATNLLAVRRLDLAIGQSAELTAAWLRFPTFNLEPLPQIYRRTDATSYHYESAGGQFVTDLQVNASGFVTLYPHYWEVVS